MTDRKKPGRPRLDKEVQPRRQIRLCDRLLEKAKRLGDGNASRGIRRALEESNA